MKTKFKQDQLTEVIKKHILPLLGPKTIFTFVGPLGAGKTTMIKEILKQCGVTQDITSPTFGYVNSYEAQSGRVFNHFDLYRIGSVDEFVTAGFDELLHNPNGICFIEWPQVIEELLNLSTIKQKVCHIKISYADNDFYSRVLEID